jgi:cardiolipin synthase
MGYTLIFSLLLAIFHAIGIATALHALYNSRSSQGAIAWVDVRVLLPEKADHLMVWLASFSYVREVTAAGVKVYRFTQGFLHQEVFVVDDTVSAVGTANLDNRSLRLNWYTYRHALSVAPR